MDFPQYIEMLAREHSLVHHNDSECHFSNLVSDFDMKLKRVMHYPCVGIDTDGFVIEGVADQELVNNRYNLYFLDHVRDNGSLEEKLHAFALTCEILKDFAVRMKLDKQKGVEPVQRLSLVGSETTRIEFADNALYGYVMSVEVPELLCWARKDRFTN